MLNESFYQQQREQVDAYLKKEVENFAEQHNITSDITIDVERQLDLINKIKAAGYELKIETGGYHDVVNNKAVTTYKVKFKSL